MKYLSLSIFIFLILKTLIPFSSVPLKINTKTRQFIDEQGRERFFRGINVVVKSFPFLPETKSFNVVNSFSEEDMVNLEDWGFNIIRLGTEWAGLEPTRGNYNMTYLEVMKEIVEKSKAHNIYTLLDFHQDLLAEAFCGEGIPRWAVKVPEGTFKFPIPVQFTAFQTDSECRRCCIPIKILMYHCSISPTTVALLQLANDAKICVFGKLIVQFYQLSKKLKPT